MVHISFAFYILQVFRKTLTRMFTERDEDVVFMETSMRLKHFPHMSVECIPIDKEVGDLAPIYFKVSSIAPDKAHFFYQKVQGPVVQSIISLTSLLVAKC